MKKKDEIQKQINLDIKQYNPNIKAFTSVEFISNEIARELYARYKIQVLNYNISNKNEILKLFNLLCSPGKEFDPWNVTEKEIYLTTKELLGLTNDALVRQVKDSKYATDFIQVSENSYESIYKESLENWIQHCKQIDEVKKYIESNLPNWSYMTKKEKGDYVKILESTPGYKKNDNTLVDYLIKFIPNYHLHQTLKAKAIYLKNLSLPNINSLALATKVCQNTTLIHSS